MRILLDSCVWGKRASYLRNQGHDVDSVQEWPADPGDEEIFKECLRARRVLVTLDKDFGELIFGRGKPNPGVVRIVGIRAKEQPSAIATVLARHGLDLEKGATVVAERDRVRIRLPEDRS
ncbi:MAG: DUF5615 family PIN-like protein [Phycisphaerae bacterium]